MKKSIEVLCEIIFKDPKLGIITSQIGTIDKSQLNNYSKNSNNFIIFNENYIAPILKSDIQQILIHREEAKILINQEDSKGIKYIKTKISGKIS